MKIFKSLITIAAVAAIAVVATSASFFDSETITGNTFSAGSIDLEVNGENDIVSFMFSESNLVPGETVNAGTVTLSNVGSLSGELTVAVSNPKSAENGMIEPELSAGDVAGTEIDPTGYDMNSGNGELWDQAGMTIYIDMNSDGVMQWFEPVVWRGEYLDLTSGSGYHIPLDTDLGAADVAHGFDGILAPAASVDLGILIKFKDDSTFSSQPQHGILNNNMAMTDDLSFDLVIGLEQL